MANNPIIKGAGPTPVSGTGKAPVNSMFKGPDAAGVLQDVPPMFGSAPTPLVVTNGVDTPKLGFGGAGSPKTHG